MNGTLSTALIGYGHWGPNIARHIDKNKRMTLESICDNRPDRLAAAQAVYADRVQFETDYRTVLQNPRIQAVAIAVETEKHDAVVKEALDAKKHVYIEKPFTSSVASAVALARQARELRLVIHVNHIMIFHPGIKKIKELLDSGELGELLYIEAMRMNLGRIRNDVSVLWDLGIHDLSVIDYLVNGREPKDIYAVGDRKYSNTESITFLTLKFDDFIAHIRSSWISPVKERKLIIAGTRKMAVFDETKPSENLVIHDTGIEVVSGDHPGQNNYRVAERLGGCCIAEFPIQDALSNSIDHFASMILDGEPSISGPDQAIRLQKILEKADMLMTCYR